MRKLKVHTLVKHSPIHFINIHIEHLHNKKDRGVCMTKHIQHEMYNMTCDARDCVVICLSPSLLSTCLVPV